MRLPTNAPPRVRPHILVVLLVLIACAGLYALEQHRQEHVTLAQGLQTIIDLTDQTVVATARDLKVTPAPDNGSVEVARRLHNNHSLSDKSMSVPENLDGYVKYNDCDGWQNLLYDGWSSAYHVIIHLKEPSDGDALLSGTKAFWESKGYRVVQDTRQSVSSEDQRPIALDVLYIDGVGRGEIPDGFSLEVDKDSKTALLGGSTPCLPPS